MPLPVVGVADLPYALAGEADGGHDVRLAHPLVVCLPDCGEQRGVRSSLTLLVALVPAREPAQGVGIHDLENTVCQPSCIAPTICAKIVGMGTAKTVTQIPGKFMSDRDLIAWSKAARQADDRLHWAREDLDLYGSLSRDFPDCRSYRESYAEAVREEDAARDAREASLDRALARWQHLYAKAA